MNQYNAFNIGQDFTCVMKVVEGGKVLKRVFEKYDNIILLIAIITVIVIIVIVLHVTLGPCPNESINGICGDGKYWLWKNPSYI